MKRAQSVASGKRTGWIFLLALALTLGSVGCASTQPAGQQLSDSAITSKVKAKLAADPQVNPFNVDVDTQDGRVTLSGKVRSDTASEQAAQLAAATEGVASVENDLQVVEKAAAKAATE